MGNLGIKGLRITGEAYQFCPEPELFIGIGKTLEKPDAEKTCGPGNKEPPSTQLLPERARVLEHMLKIFLGKWRKRHGIRR
jgi:hypothetical protein